MACDMKIEERNAMNGNVLTEMKVGDFWQKKYQRRTNQT